MIRDIYSTLLDIGTKVFFFDVRENERGKFLKIVEKRDERREQIIIPEERIEDFLRKFHESHRKMQADVSPGPSRPAEAPPPEAPSPEGAP